MNAAARARFFKSLGLRLERLESGGSTHWKVGSGTRWYEEHYYDSLTQLWQHWRGVATHVLIQKEVARLATNPSNELSEAQRNHLRAFVVHKVGTYPRFLDQMQSQFHETWHLPQHWRAQFIKAVEPGVDIGFRSNLIYFVEKVLRAQGHSPNAPRTL
jgi:hypothetical protein